MKQFVFGSLTRVVLATITLLSLVIIAFITSQIYIQKEIDKTQSYTQIVLRAQNHLVSLRSIESTSIVDVKSQSVEKYKHHSASLQKEVATLKDSKFDIPQTQNIIQKICDELKIYKDKIAKFADVHVQLKQVSERIRSHDFKSSVYRFFSETTQSNRDVLIPRFQAFISSDEAYQRTLTYDSAQVRDDAYQSLIEQIVALDVSDRSIIDALDDYHRLVINQRGILSESNLENDSGLYNQLEISANRLGSSLALMQSTLLPTLEERAADLYQASTNIMICIILSIMLMMLVTFRVIQKNIQVLVHVVDNSHEEVPRLDMKRLTFAEFKVLAKQGHKMFEARARTEKQIVAQMDEIQSLNEKLKNMANTDPLTGLPNRRQFDDWFDSAFSRAMREGEELALIMVDIDHFKLYNDYYGHKPGDDALVAFAEVLRHSVQRATDKIARYGGEEFVIMLPNTDEKGVKRVILRLIEGLRKRHIPHKLSPTAHHLTASVGAFVDVPSTCKCQGFWFTQADEALYSTKERGRGGFKIAGSEVEDINPIQLMQNCSNG